MVVIPKWIAIVLAVVCLLPLMVSIVLMDDMVRDLQRLTRLLRLERNRLEKGDWRDEWQEGARGTEEWI